MTKVNLRLLRTKILEESESLSIEDFREITLAQFEALCLQLGPNELHRIRLVLEDQEDMLVPVSFFIPDSVMDPAYERSRHLVPSASKMVPRSDVPISVDDFHRASTMIEAYWVGFRDCQKVLNLDDESVDVNPFPSLEPSSIRKR
jgi:hypothetical protein